MNYARRITSTYDLAAVKPGIVHLGLGAFHRAHQAVYLEQNLQRHQGGDWGIVAANLRSNHNLVEALHKAGHSYTVAEYASAEDVTLRQIRSITNSLFAATDSSALVRQIASPHTRMVSLTVTEKGYCIDADGKLLEHDPGIRHDLEHPENPKSPIGVLAYGLLARKNAGLGGVSIVSCDNLSHNGARTRKAVLAFAALHDNRLATWIEHNASFPNTMVDRIVPAATPQSLAAIEALLGCADPNALSCEAFIQWVVEENFCAGRPDWEHDGVEMVGDVAPYELMKLRLLNGSHSLLAYVGGMAGCATVAECMQNPLLTALIERYMLREAGPSLEREVSVAWRQAVPKILGRFANTSLAHKTEQIAMDGSQKIPQRWLNGALSQHKAAQQSACVALGMAAWLFHMHEKNEQGRSFTMNDPRKAELQACLEHNTPAARVQALCAAPGLMPEALQQDEAFTGQIYNFYELMCRRGSLAALAELLGS